MTKEKYPHAAAEGKTDTSKEAAEKITPVRKGLETQVVSFGPCGLVLRNPEPCEFLPCKGQLGFFEWKYDETAKAEPKPWMVKQKQAEIDGGFNPHQAIMFSDYDCLD